MTQPKRSWIGWLLAAAVVGAWLALHVYGVFYYHFGAATWLAAPAMIAASCWLNVGLFIIAHDCMHGSFAPGRAAVNRWVGRGALGLYAGFSFDRLRPKHFEHHRRPGTEHDPDFSTAHARRFWPWFGTFLRQYFGLRELVLLCLVTTVYVALIGAVVANVLLFWALPAILSSLQLFLFGTFLPHRAENAPFADDHRARSNEFGWLASLLSCFHFGYHHEHHLAPQVPWWQLPAQRRQARLR